MYYTYMSRAVGQPQHAQLTFPIAFPELEAQLLQRGSTFSLFSRAKILQLQLARSALHISLFSSTKRFACLVATLRTLTLQLARQDIWKNRKFSQQKCVNVSTSIHGHIYMATFRTCQPGHSKSLGELELEAQTGRDGHDTTHATNSNQC